ncbi:MAG: tetratricopeptide repeat protein [Chthoniobacterales bacterium]
MTRTLAICFALVGAVWVVFGQTLGHQFVNIDDDAYINYIVEQGPTWEGIRWAFAYGEIGHWHPLTWISHMLDCRIYGVDPAGHHFTSVLLHTASTLLLFLALQQLTGASWRSAFVAAVFAIHPLRAESVAWIAERKDVLGTFFFMLTLLAYARYVRSPSPLRYALVAVSLALGLMSKNMLVTLPCVLLLLDYWPLGRMTPVNLRTALPRLLLEKIPLFALSALSVIATTMVPEKVTANDHFDFPTRIANALDSYVVYLRQTFWPMDLVANYPVWPLPLWQSMLSLGLLFAITAFAVAWWRKRPYFFVGWFWFAGMLAPVIGIVQISFYAHADRYTYLPQIGLCLVVVWVVSDVFRSHPRNRWIPATAAALVLGSLMVLSWKQTATWRTSTALWQYALAHSRDNAVAHYSLGDVYVHEGKPDEAAAEFRRALEIKPNYPFALNALGNVLMSQGNYEESSALFRRAIELQPDYAAAYSNYGNLLVTLQRPTEAIEYLRLAAKFSPILAEARSNWGNALVMLGRADEAIALYHEAVAINPQYASAYANLGNVLGSLGRTAEAVEALQKAVEIRPQDPMIRYNLGNSFLMRDENERAVAEYRRVIEMNPNFPGAHSNFGIALAGLGKTDEAIEEYHRALAIKPDDSETLNNLGVALIARGKIEEGIAAYRRAVELQPTYVAAQVNLGTALANHNQLDDAIIHLREAARLTGDKNPGVLDTLACLLAMKGRTNEAAQIAQHALDLATAQSNSALAETIRKHAGTFQQR